MATPGDVRASDPLDPQPGDIVIIERAGADGGILLDMLLHPKAYKRIVTGTSDTIVAGDNGKAIVYENAAAIAVVLPDGLDEDFHCTLIQITAAGVPTVTPSGSDTVNGASAGVAPSGQSKGLYLNKYDTGKYYALF